jgi:hypothetical protein
LIYVERLANIHVSLLAANRTQKFHIIPDIKADNCAAGAMAVTGVSAVGTRNKTFQFTG